MKKSLFAAAATGAFAAASGVAQAQSSVTVYGILDVGYTNGSARQSAPTTTVGDGVRAQNVSRISNSMESGSRLGFRGTEDLGGGTRANFVFEVGIQPAGNAGSNADGSVPAVPTASSASNAGAPNWTPNVRQAFVGLAQKGIGEVRIGTQNTFNWEQAGSNTVGQLNQTAGSMLAPTIDGAFFSTTALNGTVSTAISGSAFAAFTNRTTNTITFRTERMAGLQAKVGAVLSNQNSNQYTYANTVNGQNTVQGSNGYQGGTSNQYGWMGALDWNIQKANVQASYQVFTSEGPFGGPNWAVRAANPSTSSSVTNTPVGSTIAGWGSGTQGTNATDAQALVTASYDFGILKAYAGWVNRKVTSAIDSNLFIKRTAQEIGVRGYATKSIEGWASVGNGRYTSWGTTAPTANITGYQIGSNYWMSKRTNLYAIYGQNATSTTTVGSASVSQASVGIRHTF